MFYASRNTRADISNGDHESYESYGDSLLNSRTRAARGQNIGTLSLRMA